MPARRAPRWNEIRPLIRLHASAKGSRVASAVDVDDLRRLTGRRAPRVVFDLVDGAADREVTADDTRPVLDTVRYTARFLRGDVDRTPRHLRVDVGG